MAQHIGIKSISQDGKETVDSGLNFAVIQKAAQKDKYPLLFGIEEYDNTQLSSQQIPEFISQLEQLKEEIDEPSVIGEISKLLTFLNKALSENQTLLFIGD